jgi:hypothetical protein
VRPGPDAPALLHLIRGSRAVSKILSTLLLALIAGGVTAAMGADGVPASKKWVGPKVPGPLGGESQTIIYYGPWQCSRAFMDACQGRCTAEGYKLMGCIWLADIKTDWRTHCCCDYPLAKDIKDRRAQWERATPNFRKDWAKEFGEWPADADGRNWHGHHVRDLGHGGEPTARRNVLPVAPGTHYEFTDAYPACYSGKGGWELVGPDRPYTD